MSGLDLSTNSPLVKQWQQLASRFDKLSKREKYILLLASAVVGVAIWQTLFIDPLLADRAKNSQVIVQLRDEKRTMENELTIINAQLQADPHAAKRQRIEKLQEIIRNSEQKLQSTTQSLIPPHHMPQAIEELFERFEGLKLLSMTNLPARPLVVEKASESKPENATAKRTVQQQNREATGLYRHAVEIVFMGDFRHTLNFLRALEGMSWRFLWDSLSYQVQSYPDATIKLQVYTFSTSEEWIGV